MAKISLKAKLLLFFLLVGLTPLVIVSAVSLIKSSNAISDQVYGQLKGMREVKKAQVIQYFKERKGDLGVLLETVLSLEHEAFNKLESVQSNKKLAIEILITQWFLDIEAQQNRTIVIKGLDEYKHFLATGIKTEDYQRYASTINDFTKINGYYDYFVIDLNGHVVYTQAKNSDYNTNILDGPHKDSGLGRVVRSVMEKKIPAIEDFSVYAPRNGESVAFIAAPIKSKEEITGVVAFQISLEKTQKIMADRSGLGQTGEAYLIGKSNNRISFRSHMVTMGKGKFKVGLDVTDIAPQYVKTALTGETGSGVFNDSAGNLAMVSYAPLKIKGLNWAIVTKTDLKEMISPKLKGEQKDYYSKYIEQYGYQDLFLIHPKGNVFYSVNQEADYQTNMLNGKYADSGLGKLVKKTLETGKYGMADFEPYAPSKGEPCSFIAQPVSKDGKIEFVVALQLSLDAVNRIMQQRDGMGKTGETYLIGSDKLMRSDSFLNPTDHSVKASFADPSTGRIETEASRLALSGKEDAKIITDYNGNRVLSAFTPLAVGDTTWALIAEIDESEAFTAVKAIKWLITVISIVSVIAIVGIAFLISRSITRPINTITRGLNEGANQVASASGQVSSASQSLAEGSSQQAASIEETSASMEEMASMTKRNADNAAHADNLMKETNQVVILSNESMNKLTQSMQDISTASQETSKIIKTIDEIAFQTNLLALNAAVEAARAGEAGAGFAVVADEVRNLAMRAAAAARNTAELIEGTVKKVTDGSELVATTNDVFRRVAENTAKVGDLVSEISEASKEQSNGIEQVNTAISEMDKVVQQNAANAEESASASEEMSAQSEQLRNYVEDLVLLVTGQKDRSNGLDRTPGLTTDKQRIKAVPYNAPCQLEKSFNV